MAEIAVELAAELAVDPQVKAHSHRAPFVQASEQADPRSGHWGEQEIS
jgi:hypothetical protein